MALLKRKKDTEATPASRAAKKTTVAAKPKKQVAFPMPQNMRFDIVRPRVTEKATLLSEGGIYTFEVSPRANRQTVAAFVRVQYGVTPRKIRIAVIPAKAKIVRGRRGVRVGGKKAYVYLKKGDKIEFV